MRESTINQESKDLMKYFEGESSDGEAESNNPIEEDLMAAHIEKKSKSDFSINVYSLFYNDHKTLVMKSLLENSDPDGVFIVLQTNFKAPKV